MGELVRRSIIKTLSFRIIGSLANFIFVWAMTDDVGIATSLFAFQMIVVTIIYYVHERVWAKISWGKK